MKFLGMIIGGILTAIGHTIAFMFKAAYIGVRRFTMDPANKNTIWNMQAISILMIVIFCFLWIVGKYQDIYYGVGEPVLFRAIPLLLPCFLGHLIYSCPLFFKSTYAKPIIQTFLNALSILAAGQIILRFVPGTKGLIIDIILFVGVVFLTLYFTLHLNIRSTVFNKLKGVVEQAELTAAVNPAGKKNKKGRSELSDGELNLEGLDLNQKGCLNHLRYNSEDCKLELFNTVPTKERQSELMVLSRSDRAQHAQIIGGTGAGKTLLATNLIVQDLLNDFIGSTIIEPKGSLINRLSNFLDRTGRTYRRLDPEYEFTDCTNPFFVPEGQDIEPMIEANVSAFHGYLGPDAEQYFKSRSTQLMRVGIKALKLAMGNECTYNELNRLIQPMNDDFRAEILSDLIGRESEVPLLLEYTRNMASGGKLQEHAMQTYSNLYDYLSELTSNKYIQRIFCGPSTFNIDDSLRNGEVVLVNGAYGTLQTLTYTVGRLYINLLRASTFRRNLKEKVRPHQLTVDELEMFADEEFSTFLEMAREFEVFVNVIHQGNVQLTDVSERLGVMVKQNAVQKFILAGLDNDDAEYYADMIGEDYQIGKRSGTDEMSTTGFNTQIAEDLRYKVLPSEILRLKGYNPETGEAGECLFRGVRNNVRLDPVIGMVYPLPRKLFAPLVEKVETSVKLEEHSTEKPPELTKGSEREGEQQFKVDEKLDRKEPKENKLDRIKRKAKEFEQRNIDKDALKQEEETHSSIAVRNTAWDADGEEEGDNGTPTTPKHDDPNQSKHQGLENVATQSQAAVNEKLNELEQYLAEKAQNGRNQRNTENG
ncbi:type IV secretory system conjugative DNA transfer family protein [Paenibacillus gansuensis]|uniref:Type IV secretory system conjugative DNA transfer family protein n=1 Tax=Paenibacillus gansuensis TaxID=306542 RepID=A0ABW5PHQ5_9BACL